MRLSRISAFHSCRAGITFAVVFGWCATACVPSFDGLTGGPGGSTGGGSTLAGGAGVGGSAETGEATLDGASEASDGPTNDLDGAIDATDGPALGDVATCVANFSIDTKNCGRCGRDCLGGACTDGECQPFVFLSQVDAREVAQDYEHVFWVTQGDDANVYYVLHDGTKKTLLAAHQKNPYGMLLTDQRIHWANQGTSTGTGQFVPNTGSIGNTDLTGNMDTHELPGENDPMFLATDGNTVWWTAHGVNVDPDGGMPDGAIRSCARVPCTSASTVLANVYGPLQIAFKGNKLYFTTSSATQDGQRGSLWSLPVNPIGIPDRIVMGPVLAYDVGIDSSNAFIYYTSTVLGTVTRSPVGAGVGGFASQLGAPWEIAVGSDYVFWINAGTSVMRMPLAGFKSDGSPSPDLKTFTVPNAGKSLTLHDQPGPGSTPPLVYFVSGRDIMKMVK
jgi:hypothetical protein